MSVRLFGRLLGGYPAIPVVAFRRVCRLCSTTRAVAAVILLLGPLLACASLPSANLAGLMRAGDPAPVVDTRATLGRTIDLSSFRQVRAAVGDMQGVSVRRDKARAEGEAAFTSYEFPTGTITYNPDLGSHYFLVVRLGSCVPAQIIRERLRSSEFEQPASRITVALYTDVRYVDRPLSAFT